jgi:hypothetical protein
MNTGRQPTPAPTPAEIARMTAEIRAGWSEETLLNRARTGIESGVDGPAIRQVSVSMGRGNHLPREWMA